MVFLFADARISKDKSGVDKIIVKKQPYRLLNTNRHFISFFYFIFILLRRVALPPELFYKGPSTKNMKIQLHNEKEKLQYKNPVIKA